MNSITNNMKLSLFIDRYLEHSNYVNIKTVNNLPLYNGLVADIPYRLAVKSTFVDCSISADRIIIHIIYHNN